MKSKLQQVSRFAVPAMLVAMMGGCASVSEMEKMQKQVNEAKASANSAIATASSANTTAQEAKSIASEARNTANAALTASSEASSFSAAAVKSSEAAVGVSVQAQKSVNELTIAIPWMRLDPATGRFAFQWIVWPSMGEYMGAPQAPAAPNGK